MKNLYRTLLTVSLLGWLILSPFVSYGQLSGTYTIGSEEDYTTFQQAADALMSQGIDGPVVFQVASGTYTEQLVIETIPGSSINQTVTFQSAAADSSAVILTWEASSNDENYVVRLGQSASYIIFKDLSIIATGQEYGRGVVLEDQVQHFTMTHCYFRVPYSTQNKTEYSAFFSDGFHPDYLTVENCYFDSVTIGVYLNNNNTGVMTGVKLIHNVFNEVGYTGIHLYDPESYTIRHNRIVGGYYGIRTGGGVTTGTLSNNRIISKSVGISYSSTADIDQPVQITNNYIYITLGGGHAYGISFSAKGKVDICYNTVVMKNDDIGDYALYLGNSITEDMVVIKNNILACMDNGIPLNIHYLPLALAEMDYNCYYTAGNFLGRKEGIELKNLSEIKEAFGMDAHSFVATPVFVSDSTVQPLTAWFNNKATPMADINEDINGKGRNAETPDVGAFEYTPQTYTTVPYSGSYTIGNGGDFTNLQQAVDSLELKGVGEQVVLNFLPGTYNVNVAIPAFSGVSESKQVILQAHDQQTETVILQNLTQEENSNGYVLKLYGADHLRFRHLTLKADKLPGSTTHYATVFNLHGGTEGVTIENNVLKSRYDSNNRGRKSILFAVDTYFDSLYIHNNIIDSCAIGFYFQGNQQRYPERLRIANNEFTHVGYKGLYLQFLNEPYVYGNTINSDLLGMSLITCLGSSRVLTNQIYSTLDYGLYINNSAASSESRGLIANNRLIVTGNSESNALYITNTKHYDVVYNSVNTSSLRTASKALEIYGGDSLVLLNNAFVCSGGGYAAYFNTTTGIDSLDYNNYFTNGNPLIKWESTVCNELADFQMLSHHGAHSLSVSPQFVSESDLHLMGHNMVEAGIPHPRIEKDCDGEVRDAATPDIGADEYNASVNYAPYVLSAMNDIVLQEDADTFFVARLDTIFADPNPDDVLLYQTIIDDQAIFVYVHGDTLKLKADTNYFGEAELIVTAEDPYDEITSDTIQVTITNVQDTPVAYVDSIEMEQGTDTTLHVLMNDFDVDGDPLIVVSLYLEPKHGLAQILQGDTLILYEPTADFFGKDSLYYVVSDDHDGLDTALVLLSIQEQYTYITKENILFRISPNPVRDYCVINLSDANAVSWLEIIRADGVVVKKQPVEDNPIVLDLSGYPSGVYLITLRKGKGVAAQLIMKR